jgi:hypothetical protein
MFIKFILEFSDREMKVSGLDRVNSEVRGSILGRYQFASFFGMLSHVIVSKGVSVND